MNKNNPCNYVSDLRHIIKRAVFNETVRAVLQQYSEDVRRTLGKAIYDIQKGAKLTFPLSRPMPIVGNGVEELRVKDKNGTYRVFYLAALTTKVIVFHAYTKTTNKTPHKEIVLSQRRLKEMLNE